MDMNKIKQYIAGTLLGLGLPLLAGVVPAKAQETAEIMTAKQPSITLGYNALEHAAIRDGGVRTRMINNVSTRLGNNLDLAYHGLNEVNDGDSKTYFGRNRFMLSKPGSNLKLLVDMRSDKDGEFDTRLGFRNTGLMPKLGGYGFVDTTANEHGVNANAFYGKPIGKKASLELLQSTDVPFKGKASKYSEIQLNRDLADHCTAFARAEMYNFGKPTYLLGLSLK